MLAAAVTYSDSKGIPYAWARVFLAGLCGLLAGCDTPPLTYGLDPEQPRAVARESSGTTALVTVNTVPIGASVQLDNGSTADAPVEFRLDVNKFGQLLRNTKVTVDFSSIYVRDAVTNTYSVALKAGDVPPSRILFSRSNQGGIRHTFTARQEQ